MTTPPIRLVHRRNIPVAAVVVRPPVQAKPLARGLSQAQQLLLDARKPRVLSRSDIHPSSRQSHTVGVTNLPHREPPPMSTKAFYRALGPPPSARGLTPTHPPTRQQSLALQRNYPPAHQPSQAPPRRSTVRFESDEDFFTKPPSAPYNGGRYAREGVAGPSNEIYIPEHHGGYRYPSHG